MARSNSGFVCHAHREWVSYEIHHVFPVGYGGPNVANNKIKICCNAHSDIHYLMDQLLAGKPVNLREYGPSIRKWARLGKIQVEARIASLIQERSGQL
jgi:hypothetical protein